MGSRIHGGIFDHPELHHICEYAQRCLAPQTHSTRGKSSPVLQPLCAQRGLTSTKLVLGYWQGFFIFFHQPIYAWWLSVAAIPLNMSWSLHNVIAWLKIKPFLSRPVSLIFIGTVILVQPYWVVEIYANFTYFHNVNQVFLKTRPWEALCRDPWWVATTIFLFYSIKTKCKCFH
jgi:hypothetical protein